MEIGVVVHGPGIVDSGWAKKIIEVLSNYGNVRCRLGGTMGRTAVIDAGLEDIIDISLKLLPSQSLELFNRDHADVIFLLNYGKSAETGQVFGYKVFTHYFKQLSNEDYLATNHKSLYESIDLIKYLFKSNMNSLMRNFHVLPPETKKSNKEDIVYKDTAHSVYVNRHFIDDSIDDILILSADHVYSMDYNKFHSHHIEKGNDLTISVLEVPLEETSRFGVFTLDDDDNIIDFEEKPKNPKSSMVSMGVYIFKKELLLKVLDELYEIKGPNLDFGKDVIPYYLEHYNVGVYRFDWYWIDLGTVNSFWELSMGFLDYPQEIQRFFKFDERFKISTDASNLYPAILGKNSNIKCSLLGKNSFLDGDLTHSVVGDNCRIEKGVTILKSVIMDNCHIKEGVTIVNAVISQNTVVEEDVIGVDEIICI